MNPRVEFDLSKLNDNIKKLKYKTNNINFLFPVKCCSNSKILDIVVDNGFGFDVSNMNEFKIIEKYLDKQFVSASGPLSYELTDCDYDNIHVFLADINSYKENRGLRINFNSNNNFNFSRFGIDYKKIDSNIRKKIKYIHFHNSDHKDLEKCEDIYKEINNILEYFPNLEIINIGGHIEELSFEEGIKYLNTIRNLIPDNILLYAEIGDFLFRDVGTLYSKVIGIKNDEETQMVTLNISKIANQRWTRPIYLSDGKYKTMFYGCSCCETDIYLETEADKLNIGDEVIFKNISPYSYEWDTSFNGIDELEYIFK